MIYTFRLRRQLAVELTRMPSDMRDGVDDFLDTYEKFGLADQTRYPGRLSPSWMNLPANHPTHIHAQTYSLWHYHMGVPTYAGSNTWNKTSDYLIHFRWINNGNHIDIVDIYTHHDSTGKFYMPSQATIEQDMPVVPTAVADDAQSAQA